MGISTIVVADTETSDLDPATAGLLEVGYVKLSKTLDDEDGSMLAWREQIAWSTLVEWDGPIAPGARGTHHISPEMVRPGAPDCLPRPDAVTCVRSTEQDDTVYAFHNRKFDVGFLPELGRPVICTLQCAKHLWPDAPDYKNQTLRYWLGAEPNPELVSGGTAHRVLYDAAVTAAILRLMLIDHSPERLLELTESPVLLKTCKFPKHRDVPWSDVPRDYLGWLLRTPGMCDKDPDLNFTVRHYLGTR